ncbi:hypothetical protein SDC9_136065 [bioreactor metagenome]|uniref:Uncharacterized protein n=1 Tax=bioreactor metagenome TaxID=1076179 RepID=A0A645DI97_9ZZZZ
MEDLHALGRLQIQRDGPLVAVHAVVVGGLGLADANAPVTRVIAATRVLDLDHFGAEVGQYHAAQRPGEDAGQIEYSHPLQREVDVLVLFGIAVGHLPCLLGKSWFRRALKHAVW